MFHFILGCLAFCSTFCSIHSIPDSSILGCSIWKILRYLPVISFYLFHISAVLPFLMGGDSVHSTYHTTCISFYRSVPAIHRRADFWMPFYLCRFWECDYRLPPCHCLTPAAATTTVSIRDTTVPAWAFYCLPATSTTILRGAVLFWVPGCLPTCLPYHLWVLIRCSAYWWEYKYKFYHFWEGSFCSTVTTCSTVTHARSTCYLPAVCIHFSFVLCHSGRFCLVCSVSRRCSTVPGLFVRLGTCLFLGTTFVTTTDHHLPFCSFYRYDGGCSGRSVVLYLPPACLPAILEIPDYHRYTLRVQPGLPFHHLTGDYCQRWRSPWEAWSTVPFLPISTVLEATCLPPGCRLFGDSHHLSAILHFYHHAITLHVLPPATCRCSAVQFYLPPGR